MKIRHTITTEGKRTVTALIVFIAVFGLFFCGSLDSFTSLSKGLNFDSEELPLITRIGTLIMIASLFLFTVVFPAGIISYAYYVTAKILGDK